MKHQEENPADAVADHVAECTDARAAIVVDGSADDVVARMIAAGWTLEERVDLVGGKRIRFLQAPPEPLPRGMERWPLLRLVYGKTEEECADVALRVAERARDAADAILLLEACGLRAYPKGSVA